MLIEYYTGVRCSVDITYIDLCYVFGCGILGLDWVGVQEEALDLFQQVVNEMAFVKSAMILFLNKSDLYDEKVCCDCSCIYMK